MLPARPLFLVRRLATAALANIAAFAASGAEVEVAPAPASASPAGQTPAAESAVAPAAALIDAIAQAPALAAARARLEAARARTAAAARLPDPTFELMYGRAKDPMGERYPMYEATLAQPLPRAGERAADRDRATAAVSMAEADFAMIAGEMAMDVAMELAEAEAARARAVARAVQVARTERILAVVDSRVATGAGRIADRLALQSNLDAMRLMVAEDERMAEDALAEARARLALPAGAPLPPFAAPPAEALDENQTPARRLASAKSAEARAMERMARASARPMSSVGLRLSREEEPMGNMDVVSLAFMTELPFRARGYARAEARAARAEEAAAHAEGAAAGPRLTAALSRAERAERLAATSRRLADDTARRLDAEYEALVRAAGTSQGAGMGGESVVLTLLMVLERQTDARLRVIEAEAAVRAARAALWAHAPATLLAVPKNSSP